MLLTTTPPLIGYSVAEKLGIPTVRTTLQPAAMQSFPSELPLAEPPEWLPVHGLYNLFTSCFRRHDALANVAADSQRAPAREVLDLPPLPLAGPGRDFLKPPLTLDGYSSLVVPKPHDWPDNHHLTGYWFLDAPPGLAAGDRVGRLSRRRTPPVCVGFSGNHNRDAAEVTAIVVQALKRAGLRGLFLTGWGGLEAIPDSDQFLTLESAPHAWLYPRMAAVVHHGGAGSTAAGLRAGVPSVLIPFTSDQPFWRAASTILASVRRPFRERSLRPRGWNMRFARPSRKRRLRNGPRRSAGGSAKKME